MSISSNYERSECDLWNDGEPSTRSSEILNFLESQLQKSGDNEAL